ncbi:MAG: 4-hydroxybenzoate octaprenyltransferase [Glaciecola sp.]
MIALKWAHKRHYWQLMRANKPIGSLLLLWPTLWGLLFAAQGIPPWYIVLVFTLGVFVMRSAGCVINDYADRHVDGSVERTKNRPLPLGIITETEAIQLFVLLVAIAFVLVLQLNWNTVLLSFAALALASIYPFMKRYTHLPQVVLGAAFGWSIPMAFMAVSNNLPYWLWIIYAANLCWTVAYDTQYAMVDKRYDLKVGIKSTAILFGRYDLIIIGLLQLCTLLLLCWVYAINQLHVSAYLAVVVAVIMFGYQYYLCKNREEARCFQAFLHNNKVGMVLTAGALLGILLRV